MRRGLQQHLAADRQAEAADAAVAHVGAFAQVGDGGAQVRLAAPAAGVVVALARALAATVEQQDAVAVAYEHPRVRTGPLRPGKAITAAPLRDGTYQPASRSPSLVVSDTSTYGRPRSTACDRRPRLVVGHDRERDRHDHEEERDRRDDADERPPQVAPQRPLVEPPRAPQHGRAEHDEHRARDPGQDRRDVVAAQAVDGDVADAVDDAGDDHQRTGRERGDRARPGSQPWIRDGQQQRERDRYEPAREVVADRRAGLAVPERIVEHPQCGDSQGDAEHQRLEARSARRPDQLDQRPSNRLRTGLALYQDL